MSVVVLAGSYMPMLFNHFHFVVETPQPNLVAGMKWFLGTYTGRFNWRHKLFGHLFSGRYKSLLVDGSGSGYLKSVCDYVHLNPVRAKLLTDEQPLNDCVWSSYPTHLQTPGDPFHRHCGFRPQSRHHRQRCRVSLPSLHPNLLPPPQAFQLLGHHPLGRDVS